MQQGNIHVWIGMFSKTGGIWNYPLIINNLRNVFVDTLMRIY